MLKNHALLAILLVTSLSVNLNTSIGQINDDCRFSPFSKDADLYNGKILQNYMMLPLVEDKDILYLKLGSKDDAIARAKSYAVSYQNYENSKTAGEHYAQLRGPIKYNNEMVYFWIVQGKLNHFYTDAYGTRARKEPRPPKGYIDNYCYIFRHDNKSATAYTALYIINNERKQFETTIYKEVNSFANSIRDNKNAELFARATSYKTWTYDKKTFRGRVDSYNNKNGMFKMLFDSGPTKPYHVLKFDIDDQFILRGYLDHLKTPIRFSDQ